MAARISKDAVRNQTKPPAKYTRYQHEKMKLALVRANGGFSQSSLSIFGYPNAEAFGRRACLSPSWAKARRASCAGAENTKDLWREKTDLSEKNGRCI
ncbi:MAG: hypothetical protein A2166_06585 [Omnitrophica WOR_2 bacterium RBG_13_41_10]|nr:MAG: hypothetical protein A2166_06585 [Omnitrophica WOR_2 bacterium RBG_13_41_10]